MNPSQLSIAHVDFSVNTKYYNEKDHIELQRKYAELEKKYEKAMAIIKDYNALSRKRKK